MILNDNSTQQINTLVIQLQNRITNLNNELKSLNKEISDLDSEISDLERKVSSNTNDQENDIAAMNAKIKANTEAISGKADKNHTHIKSQITDFDHNHDDRYYTESEVDTKLSDKANKSHTHTKSEITDFDHNHDDRYFTETEVTNKLAGKSDTGHTHTKSQITDFPTSLPANGGTADFAKKMDYQYLDLSELDKTKFYPLFCYSGIYFAEVAICSESGMGSMEYNQNRIHFDISTQGWADLRFTLNIREYVCYENNEITIGCIGRGQHNGAWAIWLRGGLSYICYTRNADLSLHTSDYTFGDEVYTVGTNYYGGSNTNVEVIFTPQSTITEGAYSSRPITAPNITSLEQRVAALESKA